MTFNMDATVFVRQPNSTEFSKLGKRKFGVLPRADEFISAEWKGSRKYFLVIGVHHAAEDDSSIELYAVEAAPPWEVKQGRAIGFGH